MNEAYESGISFAREKFGPAYIAPAPGKACSGFAAGRKATKNGHTLCCYTSDGISDFRVRLIPAADHAEGEEYVIDYNGIDGGFGHDARGRVPQVPHTYKWFDSEVPFANEKQVFISENTCASREEMSNLSHDDTLIDWHTLPAIALQRAESARKAVKIMGSLIDAYGFRGAAESFLVSDPNEVWVFETVGDSSLWVAERMPEDCVIFHANRLRIGEIDFTDGENFLYSDKLVSNALEKGAYTEGEPFNFEKIYSSNRDSMNCIRREWRASDLLCPSRGFKPNASVYPLFLRPEIEVSAQWVCDVLWRDVLEGTPFDPAQTLVSGPFNTPLRQMVKDGGRGERYISTSRIAYATVCESSETDETALTMFAADTPRTGTYVPLFCGMTQLNGALTRGSYTKADDCFFWSFQRLETLCQVRYREMHADVRKVFDPFEQEQREKLALVKSEAEKLMNEGDAVRACALLTDFSMTQTDKAKAAADETLALLFARYRDGEPEGMASEEWQARYNESSHAELDKADMELEYRQ